MNRQPKRSTRRALKWAFVFVFVLLLLLQIPFAYRRWQLSAAAEKIAAQNAAAVMPPADNLKEYKGIIHAHTSLGGHSTGHFDELISAAGTNALDFVVMTEHYSDRFDTAALTLNGVYENTLFIGGNEIDTADGDRFLMIPGGAQAAGFRKNSTQYFLETVHSQNGLAMVTYPEKFKSWDADLDGIEVFSIHTAAKKANPFTAFFDLFWSYGSYPGLTLMRHFSRPAAELQRYDETAQRRPNTLFAGTDAHSNIGFHIFGDDAGNKPLGVKIDDYASIFQVVRVHVLQETDTPLTRETLIETLRRGRAFVGFDAMGDTTGFRFFGRSGNGLFQMGDRVSLSSGPVSLTASASRSARFVVYRNGVVVSVSSESGELSASHTMQAAEPGVYRVEVYLESLGSPFNEMPWILSNPIYVTP